MALAILEQLARNDQLLYGGSAFVNKECADLAVLVFFKNGAFAPR